VSAHDSTPRRALPDIRQLDLVGVGNSQTGELLCEPFDGRARPFGLGQSFGRRSLDFGCHVSITPRGCRALEHS
jgi:hypothetical protein